MPVKPSETATQTLSGATLDEEEAPPRPGLVAVFIQGKAVHEPLGAVAGTPSVLGRHAEVGAEIADDSVSRSHAEVCLERRDFHIRDLKSRNGTFVNGQHVTQPRRFPYPAVIRLGSALILALEDIRPHIVTPVTLHRNEEVEGPALHQARRHIERAAQHGDSVLLTGASGTGKEFAARAYHVASKRKGPFVAVNCAAIPAGLAERLLFGAKKGAYSGADSDAEGYVQAANGGTLFLDEVGDLDPLVQPKLLRMLEAREILELGASKPRMVDVRVCAATLKDLREEVGAKRFRADLYYRIGRPAVRLPSLSERLEEIPFLAELCLGKIHANLKPSAKLLESCMLRPWPGNVRELLTELRRAGETAVDTGRMQVSVGDIAEDAGQRLVGQVEHVLEEDEDERGGEGSRPARTDEEVRAALVRSQGNVLAAARELGWHRNQVRRWLARHKTDAKTVAGGG